MLWLLLISALHLHLNREQGARRVVRMGYMPVVANLACPLLDAASMQTGEVRFEAIKFSSFAEMGQSLRSGHVDAAFIIAPLAIVLRQQGADVKVVYIGNRHESTLVVRSDLPATDFRGLAGHTLAVPQRFSGHNLAARQLQERFREEGQAVRIVEMNPPDMPSALASGGIDAYFVGEPFAFAGIATGKARILYRVEDVWPGFICNLMLVRADLITRSPSTVRQLVRGAARAGVWAAEHNAEAAEIAAAHWGQRREFVAAMLEANRGRFVWNRFVPKVAEMQQLADELVRFGLLPDARTDGLVDDRFALEASSEGVGKLASILR